ncbi:hypothetical protein Pint_08596 [Pistacia integerrima]|uniref:Uncharacterized protein n=1 Tax=Pistacia integerrima TaxID=434235 RepID=A0ACC0XXG6_9ROSI|nr:hypothetical protein Pint_08596 [Pistacia integerrima]
MNIVNGWRWLKRAVARYNLFLMQLILLLILKVVYGNSLFVLFCFVQEDDDE